MSSVQNRDTRCPSWGAQTAEMFRTRAVEAIDMVRFLQDFSRSEALDFSDLDDLFSQAEEAKPTEDLDRAAVRSLSSSSR